MPKRKSTEVDNWSWKLEIKIEEWGSRKIVEAEEEGGAIIEGKPMHKNDRSLEMKNKEFKVTQCYR